MVVSLEHGITTKQTTPKFCLETTDSFGLTREKNIFFLKKDKSGLLKLF